MIKKLKLLFFVVFLLFIADIGRYIIYPDITILTKTNPIPTAFMEYRIKQWQDEGKTKEIEQKWVPLKSISPFVLKAVLISEDDGFWNNNGFETVEIEQALEKNIKKGKFVAGGSTITQQLAKNLYLNPSKNPIRKLKEAILAYRINKTLSKKRIIEIYLNCAEWGDGIFGIEAAARHYYGKSAKNLSAMEAAKLASILPNPIIYHPNDNGRVARKATILYKIMLTRGIIIESYDEITKPEANTTEGNQTVETNETNTSVDNLQEEQNNSIETTPNS